MYTTTGFIKVAISGLGQFSLGLSRVLSQLATSYYLVQRYKTCSHQYLHCRVYNLSIGNRPQKDIINKKRKDPTSIQSIIFTDP